MNKLTNFKVDPKRFEIYKENVGLSYNFFVTFNLKKYILFLVHQVVKELCCRATLPPCSLLLSRTIDGTLMDQTGIISSNGT